MKKIFLVPLAALLCTAVPIRGQIVVADFERNSPGFAVSDMEPVAGMRMEIVENPVRKGINTSRKVLKMTRGVENALPWAGFSLAVGDSWKSAADPSTYRYVHIKYLREDAESEMRFKMFRRLPEVANVECRSENAAQKVGVWEDLVFDMKAGSGAYDFISVMPDFLSSRPAGTTVYIDEITFSNESEPEMIFTERVPGAAVAGNYADAVVVRVRPVPQAVSYEVYRDGRRVSRSATPEVTVPGLKPGTSYLFTVRAVDDRNRKTRSSENISVTTLDRGQLAVPVWLDYDEVTAHSVSIRWQPVYKADAYEVYENGAYYATVGEPRITVEGLKPYGHYGYRLRAVNRTESSALSRELHFVTHETPEQRDARMKWWREARFGMFLNWGVYSEFAGFGRNHRKPEAPEEWQPADRDHSRNSYGEWIMEKYEIPLREYRAKAAEIDMSGFDADQWMDLALAAGMKYIVLDAKHHDGFCLWGTQTTDWNVVDAVPGGVDVVAQVNRAAKERNIRVGLYFSHALDWANGGAGHRWDSDMNVRTFDRFIEEIGVPQVHELLSRFGKVDILWWDMPIEMTPARARKYYHAVSENYPMQQGLILDDRMANNIYFDNRDVPYELRGDHNTPEQSIPDVPPTGFDDNRDWETCMTLNETWGYKANDHLWKPAKDIIRKLADIVSKGGNFLLNIGPRPDGSFPPQSVAILREVGAWMAVNAEAIYGTQKNVFPQGVPYGRVTRKVASNGRTTHYLHVFDWPLDGNLPLPTGQSVKRAYLLADASRAALDVVPAEGGQVIKVPAEAPDAISSVVVVEME